VAGRDITEGRAERAIAVDVGVVGDSSLWQNTAESYDVAVGGLPFILATSDDRPYIRQTAPFKKDQFDNGAEPGEQSLTGWWMRSQSSFHRGEGIKFYDPSAGEAVQHRFTDSKNVDVWTKGQVTLLKDVVDTHVTTGAVTGTDHQHPNQHTRSIQWSKVNGVLLHDEFDVDKIYPAITVSISNKALTSNVATLTTSAAHGLTVGMTIVITGVDATFNGEYRITTVPTTTTFTYAKTATNVTSTAVSPVGTGVTNPVIHFIDYISGTDRKVHAICDDGVNAYWVTNKTAGGAERLTMFKKPLTGDSITGSSNPSATGDVTQMFQSGDEEIIHAAMEFIKDRIILCVNNKVYEFPTSTDAIGDGTLVYTNPNTNYHYTSIAASGSAIYTAGHSGIYSTIQKYTLNTSGALPTLTSAVVAAEMPAGEIVEKLYYYLGYMMIGTNKGVRAAVVSDQDGSINYGPLIIETSQPCYDFAGRDRFIWCATGIGALDAGLYRIDLGSEIETLRFAYAKDLQVTQSAEHYTTGVAFLGTTNRLTFCTAYETTNGAIYLESESTLASTGYLTTGYIRYGTLEPKNFKRLLGRGDFTRGSLTMETVDKNGTEYDHITYESGVTAVEVTTSQPTSAQEYVAYKFLFNRDSTDTTKGPIFKGYQAKASIATPRQRVMKFSVFCFDEETDRYNVTIGYDGRSFDRLSALEDVEENGDIVTWQDLTTGELRQVQIEQISYSRSTPPDKRFNGNGGIIDITVRTV
jgi:hypothetical protein